MHATTVDRLSWDGKSNTFTTEASTIELAPGNWPDAIRVTNIKTSGACTFYRIGFDRNSDNEVTGARYEANLVAGMPFMTLRVFND